MSPLRQNSTSINSDLYFDFVKAVISFEAKKGFVDEEIKLIIYTEKSAFE